MKKSDVIKALTLFIVTGFIGYFFEIFVDKLLGSGETGISYFGIPFLPLYAISGLIIFAISKTKIKTWIKLALSTVAITILELVTGLILLSKDVRLWDYSNHFLNYKGLISLQVSIIWAMIIIIFYFAVLPLIE